MSTDRQRRAAKGGQPAYAEMPEINAQLLERIDQRCKEQGMTHEQVTMKGNLSYSTFAYFRRGRTRNPSLGFVLRICTGLGITPAELLAGLPTPPPREPYRGPKDERGS